MFLRAVYAALFIFINIRSVITFLTLCALQFLLQYFIVFTFNFIIKFSWINLFAISTLYTHIIINIYFFFSFFLTSLFIFSIYNLKFMTTSTFFIVFVSSFLIFWNILLIFISCIIISNFSHRRIVVWTTFLIQKSFDFNIFLLLSKIILNIINFLNFCTFIMFLHVISIIATFELRINVIISFVLIFCIRFIFWTVFIYIINFIFLLSLRFENALITLVTNVKNVIIKFSVAIFV